MSPIPINLAVEDELSDFVMRRVLQDVGGVLRWNDLSAGRGYGYLRKTVLRLERSGKKAVPFALLT